MLRQLPTRPVVPPEIARRVLVGTAGWSYADWEGIVYPKPSPAGFDRLKWMSRFVDLVELNTTFYRPCSPRDAASWVKRVSGNPRFHFSAKLYRGFTHQSEEIPAGVEAAFNQGLEPLVDSGLLAALLVQYPYSFRNTVKNRQRLSRVLTRFGQYNLAVELRHRSWMSADMVAFLSARGIALVGIDQPLLGQAQEPALPLTGSFFYARLHGRNSANWFNKDAGRDARYDYLYTTEELTPWVQRVVEAAGQGASGLIVANNHFRGQALANATEIRAALVPDETQAPESLLRQYPALAALATGVRPDDDSGRLF